MVEEKKERKEVTPKDIEELTSLIDSIEDWLSKNRELSEKFAIKNKVLGFIGEFCVMKELYKNPNQDLKIYKWFGGQKEGHDIEIMIKNSPVRVQVKTSPKLHFNIMTIKRFGEYKREIESIYNPNNDIIDRTYKPQNKFKIPEKLEQEIDNQINKITADYWVLVGWKKDEKDFFILNRDDIKLLIKRDFEYYMNEVGRNTNFNYGITKNGDNKAYIQYYDWSGNESNNLYRNRWDKILGPN